MIIGKYTFRIRNYIPAKCNKLFTEISLKYQFVASVTSAPPPWHDFSWSVISMLSASIVCYHIVNLHLVDFHQTLLLQPGEGCQRIKGSK